MSEPALSVVIVVGERRRLLAGAMRSVLSQQLTADLELLIIDGRPDLVLPFEVGNPRVRYIVRPGIRHFGQLRAEGALVANAPIVAYLEEHARARPGWAATIVEAMASRPWAGIGGETYSHNPGLPIADAVWLHNFAPHLPPGRAIRPVRLLPGHNSAYRRDLLLGYGAELAMLLQCEILLNLRLSSAGWQLGFVPAMRWSHINESTLFSLLPAIFHWHRIFGAVRHQQLGWSRTTHARQLLKLPLTPLIRPLNIGRTALRHRPDLLGLYLRSLPTLWLICLTAAIGMAVGELLGLGNAVERFWYDETAAARPFDERSEQRL